MTKTKGTELIELVATAVGMSLAIAVAFGGVAIAVVGLFGV
jgi:hypothetical protein